MLDYIEFAFCLVGAIASLVAAGATIYFGVKNLNFQNPLVRMSFKNVVGNFDENVFCLDLTNSRNFDVRISECFFPIDKEKHLHFLPIARQLPICLHGRQTYSVFIEKHHLELFKKHKKFAVKTECGHTFFCNIPPYIFE